MIVNSEFSPRWWISNPHVQTILASKLARPSIPPTRRERLELADGDFLDLNISLRESGPIVCLFHGLAGSMDSAYIAGVFNELEAAGFRPVLMHWRGCSGEPNRLARSYHSGETGDIGYVIDLMRERYPDEPVFAVGFSLGANALLKYLGEQGESTPLSGAMAVCPPLVLSVGADKLNTGVTRGYQRYLLSMMRAQHEAKRQQYPELDLPEAGSSLDNFWKFDDVITAALHGYDGVNDYYTCCSARAYLPRIRRPTRVLYALDDPFFTPAVVPAEDELAPGTTLELSAKGGHVGFMSSLGTRWLDKRVAAVISRIAGL